VEGEGTTRGSGSGNPTCTGGEICLIRHVEVKRDPEGVVRFGGEGVEETRGGKKLRQPEVSFFHFKKELPEQKRALMTGDSRDQGKNCEEKKRKPGIFLCGKPPEGEGRETGSVLLIKKVMCGEELLHRRSAQRTAKKKEKNGEMRKWTVVAPIGEGKGYL